MYTLVQLNKRNQFIPILHLFIKRFITSYSTLHMDFIIVQLETLARKQSRSVAAAQPRRTIFSKFMARKAYLSRSVKLRS